ncbi:MAG TPA: phosphatase PAP2/dual specificity phosphatase family protein [Chthoniobacterales bacterium]|nr:phosphatase PAP2/dual specificity phosphatase family protein [Chthoniobacterales bacterium]
MSKMEGARALAGAATTPPLSNIERRSARLTVRALGASIGLSVLFLCVYGWCNWITAQRRDVATLYFEWERLIPFVPLMIVPYMSIDLFFVAAPFLCRSERELTTFSKRIVAAIAVAGICFLLFPLRFAFDRPHASGWLGAVFDWFRGMDKPYNLLPSLHIAFRTILAQHYSRHTRGFWRSASNVWFVLVGLSTLLTYQHHFMDVAAGFALGVCCIYFVRESALKDPVIENRRIGLYYAAAALVLACLVVWFWPWGALFLWPMIALVIVASAYFGLGPVVFHKSDGRLHWSAQLVLAPCLLGQWLSLLYYRRQCRPWDQVTPQIWIGRTLSHAEAAAATRLGVTAVLDLTAEFSEPKPFRALIYRNIPILDLTAPSVAQLHEMAAFIDHESRKGVVYIHCKIGYSRTAGAAAAYLLSAGKADRVAEAIALLREVRPSIVVRPEVVSALAEFVRDLPVLIEENSGPLFSSPPGVSPP